MGSKFDENTKEALSRELREVRQRCVDTHNIIENSPLNQNVYNNNVGQSALNYVEGLRTQIQDSETGKIPVDENLIINQFIKEIKVKNQHMQMLCECTRATILDVQNEIQRLNNHTAIAEEALSKPRVNPGGVTPEQIDRTRDAFRNLKTELHGLIRSVFKDDSDIAFDIIGRLMQLKEDSNGYIEVEDENAIIIEMLKDLNIISVNPYNKLEVKFAY
ncbi:uncharacterized protein LOC112044637 [Bicyclus anynana]|uniref:Uncharacterized protein LOC112044637 n=1 Tax=Bicyclus anynana TaxID=110368 RepID=A0A6J1ML93_BICAN|nr:uncharacterized protein LOC112044637 [Bicyclus anynana]